MALDLARYHDPTAFDVEVVALIEKARDGESEMQKRFREAGVRTHAIVQRDYRSPWALWRIFSYLKRGRFDIVHGHNRGSDYWGARIGAVAGVPGRSWTRHLVYDDMTAKQSRRYRAMAGSGARVVAVSEAVRSACLRIEGLDGSRVETIVNGVDLSRFRPLAGPERIAVRARLGLTPGQRMLLFVGRFSEQKCPEGFVALVERLRESHPEVRGFMCGYGPLQDSLVRMAASTNGGVEVLGLRSDVPDLLGACDLFVSTSRNEGLPLNLMEAMSCGVPFIAPAIPQIVELTLGDRELAKQLMPPPPVGMPSAELVRTWARLAEAALEDPGRCAMVGQRGREIMSENFSVQTMTGRYEEFFRRLCGVPS